MTDILCGESVVLPEWAAVHYRELAEKCIFLQEFPACFRSSIPLWQRNPYSDQHDGWHFVYLTNRKHGRYTYLFEERPLLEDVRRFPIQVGYSSLWLLRKILAFPAKGNVLFMNNARDYSAHSIAGQPNCVVLQDPLMKLDYHDVVFQGNAQSCIEEARTLFTRHAYGFLVAEVLEDLMWH